MKKIFAAAAISLLLASCTKEKTAQSDSATAVENSKNTAATENNFAKKFAVSPDQVTQLLAPKNNDTLYVTNFFATWCGPCMREIPEFKAKMTEMKGKPVKFTFVNLDDKTNWDTDVKNFVEDQNLGNQVVLLDGTSLNNDFFSKNFKDWKGETIPFTIVKKREKSQEMQGAMSAEELTKLLAELK